VIACVSLTCVFFMPETKDRDMKRGVAASS
jgi:hypothetical protein